MGDRGKAAAGVDNTSRRKWDLDEYADKAAERDRLEEEKLNPPRHDRGEIVVRDALKSRDYQVDLTSRLGKTQIVSSAMPLSQQAGYFCNVCQCIVKDSANFLDHINGKKHQKALGMSMRIERVGLEAVKNRFESNKRKQQQQAERNEDDYETRLIRLQDEEERQKLERKERKRQKKEEAEKAKEKASMELAASDEDGMMAMMGFGGFGGGAK